MHLFRPLYMYDTLDCLGHVFLTRRTSPVVVTGRRVVFFGI
jgi:hypothetical protein